MQRVGRWEWCSECAHLRKTQFFEVFTPAWNAAAKPETAIAGFRGTGTWPMSCEVIPAEAFEPSLTTERPLVTAEFSNCDQTADSTAPESIAVARLLFSKLQLTVQHRAP